MDQSRGEILPAQILTEHLEREYQGYIRLVEPEKEDAFKTEGDQHGAHIGSFLSDLVLMGRPRSRRQYWPPVLPPDIIRLRRRRPKRDTLA